MQRWLLLAMVAAGCSTAAEPSHKGPADDSKRDEHARGLDVSKSEVEHDYGCPVAAAGFIKKMKQCDLETNGITEDLLCGKSSPIDSRVVRMLSNSSNCDELKRYLNIN